MMGSGIEYVVCVFLVAVFSIILHELAHGVVAMWLGDDTAKHSGRLTLNPLKHIDPVMTIIVPVILAISGMPVFGGAKPVPINTYKLKFREWGFALVAIAGPLMNFLLALAFYLVGYWIGVIAPGNGTFYLAQNFWGQLFSAGITTNLGFMLFNIIPIPPLDGSRVLYAIAPDGARRVMEQIERYGIIIIYVAILIFGTLLSNYLYGAMTGIFNLFSWMVGGA